MGTVSVQEITVWPPFPGFINLQRQSFQLVYKVLPELEAFVI